MKVFIWFLFFLPMVYAAENYDPFDYYQFVQQWRPTVVIPKFDLPEPLNFTIRGFWPSNFSFPEPLNCSGSPFNLSEIEPLIPDLNIYWPNLAGDCNECFWRTEWDHHGTCSEKIFTEFGYFFMALKLKERNDILRILSDGDINPSPTALYHSSNISDLIKNKTGHIPRLWCEEGEHPSPLREISICYDLAFAYINCPQKLLDYPRKKCDDIVRYPKYPRKIPDNGTDKKDEL